MTTERWIRAIAGTFVLASLALGYLVSPYWHLFTAFVGANLLQSAFTRWCPMETFLARLGVGRPVRPCSAGSSDARPTLTPVGR